MVKILVSSDIMMKGMLCSICRCGVLVLWVGVGGRCGRWCMVMDVMRNVRVSSVKILR